MNRDQFNYLTAAPLTDPTVTAADDAPGRDRTLLFGYDTDRHTWHVYKRGGQIHRVIYVGWDNDRVLGHEARDEWAAGELVPNKRLYPERCDYMFCAALKSRGAHLYFTTFSEFDYQRFSLANEPFHGLVSE